MKAAYIFPGQGSQFVGMGKEFYEQSSHAKEVMDDAETVLPGLKEVMFNGPEETLKSTKYCQPAIFTASVAALKALEASELAKRVTPVYACGHSLGEYSALVATGGVSFKDGLKLVERRSAFMEEATKLKEGAMAAVIGMDKDKLIELCLETQVELANFNAPDQIVITGEKKSVEDASRLIKDHGAKRVIPLPVSGAFHSSLMKPASDKFKDVLKSVTIHVPRFPILSNVDAVPENNPEYIRTNLAKQITSSVHWVDTIEYIVKEGISTFIEIGPGNVLKGLLRKIDKNLTVFNVSTPGDIEQFPA